MDNEDSNHLDNQDISENEYEGHVSPFSEIPYKFRFTFSDQDNELKCLEDPQFISRCKMIWRCLINKFSDNGYFHQDRFTSGFEVMSKGEPSAAHVHIAFKSTHNKTSMNRTIKRFLTSEFDQDYLGNKSYSFVPELVVKDDEKFFRYPLKQGLDFYGCRGFTREKLVEMHKLAKDSYAISCQVYQQKKDNKDKDDTLFLRVLSKCKKQNDNTKRAIAKTFYNFYVEENKPVNRQVISGYVLNALIKLKLMTVDELLDEHGY